MYYCRGYHKEALFVFNNASFDQILFSILSGLANWFNWNVVVIENFVHFIYALLINSLISKQQSCPFSLVFNDVLIFVYEVIFHLCVWSFFISFMLFETSNANFWVIVTVLFKPILFSVLRVTELLFNLFDANLLWSYFLLSKTTSCFRGEWWKIGFSCCIKPDWFF